MIPRPIFAPFVLLALLASAPAQETMPAKIAAIMARPDYKSSRWGLLAVDASNGQTVASVNPDQFFIPASTTKLYTCAAALDALGPDDRVATTVAQRGDITLGRLAGDLILVGAGDLTLGGRRRPDGKLLFCNVDHTYADPYSTDAALVNADPLAGLNDLATQVRKAGIRRVTGRVLADDRLFDGVRATGSGPDRVSPFVVNDNCLDVLVTPAIKAGEPATARLHPATAYVALRCEVVTAAMGTRPFVQVMNDGPGRIVVRGELPAGGSEVVRIEPIEAPSQFARVLFREALERAGVVVEGGGDDTLPARPDVEKLTRIASFASAPLREHVLVTLKVSHNLYASTLPLLVAVHQGERTLADGLKRQGLFLKRLGMDSEAASFAGGAGGSPADLTTPRATVELLTRFRKHAAWPALAEGLPVLGVDGTLAYALPEGNPAKGRVRAKTGTLAYYDTMNSRLVVRSKALAGVATTANGREILFALFVNDVPLPAGRLPAWEGRVLGEIAALLSETETSHQ